MTAGKERDGKMDAWMKEVDQRLKELTNTQETHTGEIKANDEKLRKDDRDMEQRLLAKIEEAKYHR